VGPWTPDLPDYGNPGSINVRNVYPKTSKSYGPWPSPMVYSDALTARCQGGAAFIDNLGNVNLFAGDQDEALSHGGRLRGLDRCVQVGGYSCPADGQWNSTYLNGVVIANNLQRSHPGLYPRIFCAFADLAAAAPNARYSAVVKNFLMVTGTYDATDADQPQRAWWPALNDPTNWPTPGTTAAATVQSSFDDLLGDQGFMTGIVGNLGNADGAVFIERAVYRMLYSGPPETFDFPPAVGVVGCVAPGSIVSYANRAFYLGPDGFYAFDGASADPIGANKFDKTFYADLDQSYMGRIVGTADPINRQIIWAYPGQGNINGNPNRLLFYSTVNQRATICDVTCETIARMLSVGYTLDQLYTVLGYTLDNLPAPLDSRVWTGGQLLLGLFDTTHKLNYMTGANLAPLIDTTEAQPFPGTKVGMHWGKTSCGWWRSFYRHRPARDASGSGKFHIGYCHERLGYMPRAHQRKIRKGSDHASGRFHLQPYPGD
jgi:hypothetical protein